MPASCERTQQTLVEMGFTIWIMYTLRHQDSSNICGLVNLYPASPGSGNIYEPFNSRAVYAIWTQKVSGKIGKFVNFV